MITVTGAGATTVSSSIVPYSAQSCAGDVCMYLSTPSGGTVKVEGWPYSMYEESTANTKLSHIC